MSPLDGVSANGINDYGKIGGEDISASGPQALAWYPPGGFETLPAYQAIATAVSNNGQVAGDINNGHEDNLAVMWSWKPVLHIRILGVLWENPRLPGYGTSGALAMNDRGHIVG